MKIKKNNKVKKKITFSKAESGRILLVTGLINLLLLYRIPKIFSLKVRWYDRILATIIFLPFWFVSALASSGLNSVEVQRSILKVLQLHIFYIPPNLIILIFNVLKFILSKDESTLEKIERLGY